MPKIAFIPKKPNFATTKSLKASQPRPQNQVPVLVPIEPPIPAPTIGAYSSAFSNAFD